MNKYVTFLIALLAPIAVVYTIAAFLFWDLSSVDTYSQRSDLLGYGLVFEFISIWLWMLSFFHE